MSKPIRLGLAALVAATLLGAAPSAFAGAGRGGGGNITSGPCSMNSTWKLKLSHDDGQIEVEFEVDQNVSGDTWRVILRDNGERFFRGKRTTKPPSGSFEVRKLTADRSGSDHIVARATNLSTGEVCRGTGSI